jgi:transposase
MAGKKGMKHYPVEMKLEAVRLFYEEGRSRAEITVALGIQDPDRVKKWLKQYRREGLEAFGKVTRGRPPKKENTQAHIGCLEMENALLKKLRTELRKLALAERNIGSSITIERTTQ